jgi:hypothetical protein
MPEPIAGDLGVDARGEQVSGMGKSSCSSALDVAASPCSRLRNLLQAVLIASVKAFDVGTWVPGAWLLAKSVRAKA